MLRLRTALILLLVALAVGTFARQAEATGPTQPGLTYRAYLPLVAVSATPPQARDMVMGIVWNDANGNGVQDPDESALAGIPVSLTATHLDSGADPTSSLLAIRTDAHGAYSFKVFPGYSYTVQVMADTTHYTATTPTQQTFQTPSTSALYFAFGLKPR